MIGITQYTSTLLGSASINDIIATSRTFQLAESFDRGRKGTRR